MLPLQVTSFPGAKGGRFVESGTRLLNKFKRHINMEEQKNPQVQIGLTPEVGVGVYSNLALITHSNTDFVLDFACILPGLGQPQVRSRVIMAPEHAKRLLQALQENVYKYEQTFGKIEIPNQQERTIAPFNVKGNGGEA